LRCVVANSDLVGEAFSVDAAHQLDSDVDVSIGSAWNDRRRKVVALHDSQRVAAPAKSNTKVWLLGESHFVGVDSHE
jgi:hypothetical protein